MKEKVLIATILLLAAAILFAIPTAVKADGEAAEIGNEKYATLDEALHRVQDGQTIKLLRDVSVGEKNIASSGGHYADNGKVGRIEPLVDEKKITFTLDLNGKTISSSNDSQATFYVEDGSTMTIKDSVGTGKIENTGGRSALIVKQGTVTLDGGTYTNTGDNQTFGAVQVGAAAGDAGTVIVNSGATITGNYGISVSGSGSHLTVEGGTITATNGFAIAGNGSGTKNSTITINGGNITSNSTAIYHPQSGKLTINGGTITGNDGFGVVVRNGTVDVKGGTITGKGTGKGSVGDAKEEGQNVELPKGSAILVDNKSEGYTDSTDQGNGNGKVNISGGTLNSQDEKHDTVVSYNGENGETVTESDFDITGGAYSAKFNQSFIKNGAAEVSIEKNGDKTYYVGNTAKTAVENAESGSVVTVEKGNLTVTSLPNGVIVSGNSTGAITVTNPSSSGSTASALKSNLQALIAKAEGEENKTEGLTNAINTAKTILANPGATYENLQQALANLQSAYDNFKNGNANTNQEIVSGNGSNEAGDKGKLDEEPKMGESLTVFGVIAVCAVLMLGIKSRK